MPKIQPKKKHRSTVWRWLPIAVVIAAVIVFVILRFAVKTTAQTGIGAPVPSRILSELQHTPFSTPGTKQHPLSITPPLKIKAAVATAKPSLLFVGADFCPYCAATRWPLTIALMRFGHFSHLSLMESSSTDVYRNTPTFSYHGATYSSPYVAFTAREIEGRTANANGSYPQLDPLNQQQLATVEKYDAPPYVSPQSAGSIPFIDMASTYLWSGAPLDPAIYAGHTWASIAKDIASGHSTLSRTVRANADEFTAAICTLDHNRPKSICHEKVVAALASQLAQAKVAP